MDYKSFLYFKATGENNFCLFSENGSIFHKVVELEEVILVKGLNPLHHSKIQLKHAQQKILYLNNSSEEELSISNVYWTNIDSKEFTIIHYQI